MAHKSPEQMMKARMARAVREHNAKLIPRLIEQGTNVDEPQFLHGQTALMRSAGSELLVKTFIAAGANLHAVDNQGDTALTLAIRNKSSHIVDLLLEAGYDGSKAPRSKLAVSMKNTLDLSVPGGWSLLTWAVLASTPACLDALLAMGCPPDATTQEGYSPLQLAASHGKIPMVRSLLAAGADPSRPDLQGRTPLISAAANIVPTDIASMLLEAGAPIDAVDDQGHAALWHAVRSGHADCATLLMGRGCSIGPMPEGPADRFSLQAQYDFEHCKLLVAIEEERRSIGASAGPALGARSGLRI